MAASESYLSALRAAMNPSQQVVPDYQPDTDDSQGVGLNPQPLPPGYDGDPSEAAPHPMLGFNIDYDQLSKDRNDEVMANNNAIDQANNSVLAQQKANAVEDKSAAIIADDQRRRADLRNRLIMAGNKNPDQEVARLMGPVPAAAMADKVKAAVGNGDAGVQATPRGIETGIGTGAANLSRGADVPKPEPKVAPEAGTVGYVPKAGSEDGSLPPLNLKLGGGGGAASASAQSSSPVGLSPETEKAFQEARTAHQDLTQAEIAANQAETVGQGQLRQLAEEQAADTRTRAEQADKEAARIQSEIDAQSKQVADVKIDPQRLYNSKSTADKIMYHLAIMLGGMGLHGGQPNLVLEQANKEAERDIDAQRQAIESGKQRIADMKGGLAEFYRRTGNMDQAVALAQAKSYESMIHQINEYKSSTNDKIMQARGDGAIAELDGKYAAAIDAARAADAAAKAKAAAGGGSDMKKLAEYTHDYVKAGVNPVEARRLAAHDLLLVDSDAVKGIGGVKTGEHGKLAEAQQSVDAINKQFASYLTNPAVTGAGLTEQFLSKAGSRVAPESSHAAQELKDIGEEIMSGISGAAKDVDGKPNKARLEELYHTYVPTINDTPEMRRQRILGAQRLANSLREQQGAIVPHNIATTTATPTGFKQ